MRRFLDKHIVLLTLIPVLAVMIMIFRFSSQTGEESGALSDRITVFVISAVRPDYDARDAAGQALLFGRVSHLVRKAAHFSEFAALGFFLLGHFRALGCKTALRRPALWALAVGVLYAVSDEFHQGFVGGRSPGLVDVAIDSAGVCCGILVMALILALLLRRKVKTA